MSLFQVDVKDLPSRGFGYGVDYIEMESLDVNDIFDIATSTKQYLEDVLDSLIKRKNLIKNMNIDDILIIDKQYLYLKLKEGTYTSSMFEIEFECSDDRCGYSNEEFEVDIFEVLTVDQIPEDFVLPTFKYGPNEEFELKMKFPTIGDIKKTKQIKNNPAYSEFYDDYRAFLTSTVVGDVNAIYEIISGRCFDGETNFTPKDVKRFIKFINKVYIYGINNSIELECPECGTTRRLQFHLRLSNFI